MFVIPVAAAECPQLLGSAQSAKWRKDLDRPIVDSAVQREEVGKLGLGQLTVCVSASRKLQGDPMLIII